MKIGISYSWDDEEHKEWVLMLAARLEAAGFEVLYDRGQELGGRLPHFMEQMVSQSLRVLVICTAKYKQRFDQRVGGVGYEGHLISGEVVRDHGTVKFIPVLRRDSWADAMPLCLDGTLGADLREGGLYDAQCEKLFAELSATAPLAGTEAEPPSKAPARPADRTSLPPITPLRPPFHMPFRSIKTDFVGRVDTLWAVYDQLSQGKTSVVQGVGVVYGAGGLGKTQLAVEYVHRFNHHYPGGVFWVEADRGIARLIDVLSTCCRIEVDGSRREPDQLATIWMELSCRSAILLVLDNFPEDDHLAKWLPSGGAINVLVTTRRRDLTRYPHLTLPVMTPVEGQRLLNRFDSDACEIVKDVGGLPLALELLRAYLDTTPGITSADLRLEIKKTGAIPQLDRFANDYRDDLPTGHNRNVGATIQLSWNLVSKDARDILHVMSHLAPTPVPSRLLHDILSLSWSITAQAVRNVRRLMSRFPSDRVRNRMHNAFSDWPETLTARTPAPFHRMVALDLPPTELADRITAALKDLWRLSLADVDQQQQPSAHRLTLAFVRSLAEGDMHWIETVAVVAREMQRAISDQDMASYRELDAVLPHAETLLSRPDLPTLC